MPRQIPYAGGAPPSVRRRRPGILSLGVLGEPPIWSGKTISGFARWRGTPKFNGKSTLGEGESVENRDRDDSRHLISRDPGDINREDA